MSTIKSDELRERERQSLCMLVQAQWDLIMVRGLQVVAAEEETEMQAKCEAAIEIAHERLDAELDQAKIELGEANEQIIELRALLAKDAPHEH